MIISTSLLTSPPGVPISVQSCWNLFPPALINSLVSTTYTASHTSSLLISTLLFQDRYSTPAQNPDGSPAEEPRCVYGPEAWLEGLRYKGWTLATILVILQVAYRCNTTASLLGQGDNQVIVLRIPSSSYLAEKNLTPNQYTEQFLQVLEAVCEEAGIVIKVPESWRSCRLLEYGYRLL